MKKQGIRLTLAVPAAILVFIGAYSFSSTTKKPPPIREGVDEPPAGAFTYEEYADVLKDYVDARGMVNYQGLEAGRTKLDRFLASLAHLDPETLNAWPDNAKIAFWTNAYNALTLKSIIDNYPIKVSIFNPKRLLYPANSIRQIGGVWDETEHPVPGGKMTLDGIEHEVLRANFNEPRIHMALVCAAMGCPPLRNEPYTGEYLDSQLDDQTKRFLADPEKFRIDRDAGKVHLSSIFKWFGDDFVNSHSPEAGFEGHSDAERAVLNFASNYLEVSDSEYLQSGEYSIQFIDYDWSLNEQ